MVAAAVAAASLSAQSAVVVASFDPAIGPAVPGVGFRGTAQFFIADACLSLSGIVGNSDTCSNNTMAVQVAAVEFYDLSNTSSILGALTFPGSSFSVSAAEVTGGEVTGIETLFADPAITSPLAGFVGTISLRFAIGDGRNSPGGAELQLCDSDTGCKVSTRATDITYTRLPEPASVALVGLALLGAAGASRRRA